MTSNSQRQLSQSRMEDGGRVAGEDGDGDEDVDEDV